MTNSIRVTSGPGRPAGFLVIMGVLLSGVLAGCGGSAGNGGADGEAGDAGKQDGPGADGGAVGASCVSDLIAACGTGGECHYDSDAGQYCYASGARLEEVQTANCYGGADAGKIAEIRVLRADGSLCFTFTSNGGPYCEGASYSWTGADGGQVATGSTGSQGGQSIQCAGPAPGGSCGSAPLAACPSTLPAFGTFPCSSGPCPFSSSSSP